MKRIIELPDDVVKAIQNGEDYRYDIHTAIAQSIPYNSSGDCISREGLRKEVTEKVNFTTVDGHIAYDKMLKLIDNAPTVDLWQMRQEATENALKKAEVLYDRPKGEWISREALKDIAYINKGNFNTVEGIREWIDNAPAVNTNVVADAVVKIHENIGYEQGFNDGYAKCVTDNERPQGDCISREALKEQINATDFDFGDYYDNTEEIRKCVCETIDNAQAISLPNEQIAWEQGYEAGLAQGKHDRPQGEWINHRNDYGHNTADCSFCGKTMQWHDEDEDGIPRYCWYCGADMRKGGAE